MQLKVMCELDGQRWTKFGVISVEGVEWLTEVLNNLQQRDKEEEEEERYTSSKEGSKTKVHMKIVEEQGIGQAKLSPPAVNNPDREIQFNILEGNQGRGWEEVKKGLKNMLELRETLTTRQELRMGSNTTNQGKERRENMQDLE